MPWPERAATPGRPRRENWQSSRIRVLLSEEDVRVLAGLAQPGERPLDTLRRALRMAADREAVLRRLDQLEQRLLAGMSTPPPASSPAPAPAPDDPVAKAAAAILRWGGGDDDAD